MANVLIEETTMQAIADAIRAKTGESDKILPADMANEIEGIKTGSGATEPYIEMTMIDGIPATINNVGGVTMHGFTRIPPYLFYMKYTSLKEIVFADNQVTELGAHCFYGLTALEQIDLPDGITTIGESSLAVLKKITSLRMPKSLKTIGRNAISSCTKLTIVTFQTTPETIDSTAFSACDQLTIINVPWSEGAVDYAPWGATNATINYDYTGE